MAVAFGKISPFNPSQDEWPLYVERLGHMFEANEITDAAKKRAIFSSVIGAGNYKLLSSLVAPAKPGDKIVLLSGGQTFGALYSRPF